VDLKASAADTQTNVKMEAELASIPVVDLSVGESKAAATMGKACREFGFFYLTGHNVPDALVADLFAAQRRFFGLPLDQKMSIAADGNNRGYTPMGDETLDPRHSKAPDTHEGLYFGREVAPDSEEGRLPLHGPNQWPAEQLVPGYKDAVEAYIVAVRALGCRTLRVLALSLGLDRDHFDMAFTRPMIALRPLRYA
jgi:isopenicillin N synthase-like dioxygenase